MFVPSERRRTEMRKRENISAVETKNGEGKGGKYSEKENIMSVEGTTNKKENI